MSYDISEIIVLIIGIITLLFIKNNYQNIKKLPSFRYFLISFYLVLTGWFLSILEGFFLHRTLNMLEHTFYALSSISLAIWCYRVFVRGRV